MFPKSTRIRLAAIFTLIFAALVFSAVKFGRITGAQEGAEILGSGPLITATNNDTIFTDVDGDGRADPGDTLLYTVNINNTAVGAPNATGMKFVEPLDANTTIVAGSVNTSPIALDQTVGTNEDVALPITLTGIDPDGQTLTFTIVTRTRSQRDGGGRGHEPREHCLLRHSPELRHGPRGRG